MSLVAERVSVALGGREVVSNVSARLEAGTLVGLLGPNGAGKSTLVRALVGLLPPTAGRVLLGDEALAAMPRTEAARRLAYLPQGQSVHWPLTVRRVVELGRLPHLAPFSQAGDADAAAVERALARADVGHLAARDVTELSGGERARVLLARALAVEAPVLVVDEPLASLDPAHQLAGMAMLRAEAEAGALVVAVLHDLTLAARWCDRLLVLERGRLVADGAPAEALTPELLAQVYGVRAKWVRGAPVVMARV